MVLQGSDPHQWRTHRERQRNCEPELATYRFSSTRDVHDLSGNYSVHPRSVLRHYSRARWRWHTYREIQSDSNIKANSRRQPRRFLSCRSRSCCICSGVLRSTAYLTDGIGVSPPRQEPNRFMSGFTIAFTRPCGPDGSVPFGPSPRRRIAFRRRLRPPAPTSAVFQRQKSASITC
jgi:hypothetical protein